MNKLYLSPALAAEWGLASETVKIRAGQRESRARVILSPGENYQLSPGLKADLALPHAQLKLRYDPETGNLRLGPIVGILATALPNRPKFDRKSLQAELIYLCKVSRELAGEFFIFTPKTINWAEGTVKGFRFIPHGSMQVEQDQGDMVTQSGAWRAQLYPLPDVVYDRIASRKAENSALVRETKKKLMQLPGLQYFNPFYLNKWEVYQYLSREEALRPHLPHTLPLTEENLRAMLGAYPVLFIKPSNGTLGYGIIKLERKKEGKLHFTLYKGYRERNNAGSAAEFMRKTKKFRGQQAYIVQQGLNLARYNGSPFDLRVICQKDGSGSWVMSKHFCRVAPPGSSIANLSRGGSVVTAKAMFAHLFRRDSALIAAKKKELSRLCNLLAESLELGAGKLFGELGLDLGLDKRGNIWVIEINSRPRKTTVTDFSAKIVKNTFTRPLEYASYLAGFP
jgi:glutathione synthase/RimK-type ligase-like ATP-grasp enzyme